MDALIIQRTESTLYAMGLLEDAQAVRNLEHAMRQIHQLADATCADANADSAATLERIRNLATKALT